MDGYGVFLSQDDGGNWTKVDSGEINANNAVDVYSVATNDSDVFVSASPGVFHSTDYGKTWGADTSFPGSYFAFGVMPAGNGQAPANLFLGFQGGVERSTNNGTSWAYSGLGPEMYRPSQYLDTDVFAACNLVDLSTNEGSTWTEKLNSPSSVNALAVSGTNLFAASENHGVFLSTDLGNTWTTVNTGLGNVNVMAFAISSGDLYAATWGNGVWVRPLSDMVTSVKRTPSSGLPSVFELRQNYPNPFNPTTVISYQLPEVSNVTLKVYDILGREVATLVNQRQNAGSYSVRFDGNRLASGVYFYKLSAGNFVSIKKLVVLK